MAKAGAVEAVYEMGKASDQTDTDQGLHMSSQIEPRTDAFGTFNRKWEYVTGCTVATEFGKKVGELVMAVRDDSGKKRVVAIGRTPAEWNPRLGSTKVLEGAGTPGDYLMAVTDNAGQPDQTIAYRYLDAKSLEDVVVQTDKPIVFNANPETGRPVVQVRGNVEKVVGLVLADSSQ